MSPLYILYWKLSVGKNLFTILQIPFNTSLRNWIHQKLTFLFLYQLRSMGFAAFTNRSNRRWREPINIYINLWFHPQFLHLWGMPQALLRNVFKVWKAHFGCIATKSTACLIVSLLPSPAVYQSPSNLLVTSPSGYGEHITKLTRGWWKKKRI